MVDLTGKIAIITGAGSGIGKETAITFAKQGASVVCADIKGAKDTKEEIIQQGGKAISVQLDVAKWDQWTSALEKTECEFGKPDILCSVAGISEAINIVDLTEEQFDLMMNVNVKGVYFGMKAVLPGMLEKALVK